MGYPSGSLAGGNCKCLQQGALQGPGEWNAVRNETLRSAFEKDEDVNVTLVNFHFKGAEAVPFGNNLTVLHLSDEEGVKWR